MNAWKWPLIIGFCLPILVWTCGMAFDYKPPDKAIAEYNEGVEYGHFWESPYCLFAGWEKYKTHPKPKGCYAPKWFIDSLEREEDLARQNGW
jgi:hypothetical protein